MSLVKEKALEKKVRFYVDGQEKLIGVLGFNKIVNKKDYSEIIKIAILEIRSAYPDRTITYKNPLNGKNYFVP